MKLHPTTPPTTKCVFVFITVHRLSWIWRGDRLLASPCLLYYFYRNVQWGRWFTYLHMYSYQSLFVVLPVYAQTARLSYVTVACCVAADPIFWLCWLTCLLRMTRSNVTAAVFKLGARFLDTFRQMLLNKDGQCCESWRDAELVVRAVCAVSNTTDEDRWVNPLCCSPYWHCRELLTNDTLTTFSSSFDCYDWRRPSPPPVLRRQQSVPLVSTV